VIAQPCDMCGTSLDAADLDAYGDVFLTHVRTDHADLPYPDVAIRNYGAGLARMAGAPTERRASIGTVEIHAVDEDRIDDWLELFDRKVFAGFPQWSACYCTEPHLFTGEPGSNMGPWRDKRAQMIDLLRGGGSFGYLAYVGVSCFAVAPPFRGHGIAKALLDRVIDDAPGRGADWVEAYPFNEGRGNDNPDFRGPRPIYDERGFTEVQVRQRDTVVRRPAAG
jgi:GNAT superfamily N-acetyltransferase